MKNAFTLAEVLITLGIIGIVAAITIPGLISNHKQKESIVKLKKFYSTINQAYKLALDTEGLPEDWNLSTSIIGDDGKLEENSNKGTDNFWDIMSKYLQIAKRCKFTENNCNAWTTYAMDSKTVLSNSVRERVVLSDGTTIVSTWINSASCNLVVGTSKQLRNSCGDFSVDLNGKKPPNSVGKDIFFFYINKEGIYPIGMQDDTSRPFETNCTLRNTSIYSGYACSAWILFNENMDYLACDDLSWAGKNKCN